ncbi:MAG: type II secretion system protein [bacterium]|nr:type II secretion system protein [bacterium]
MVVNKAFTLAEVLITLAIIGVVAAISIPSVISNSQQQEFKTGLRKAVSVLNSAITMNIALDGESPYENSDLFTYLQRHMSVLESTTRIQGKFYMSTISAINGADNSENAAFYTTDGMRFEFAAHDSGWADLPLHESNLKACNNIMGTYSSAVENDAKCNGCGSLGLSRNPDNTTKRPCLITVDVNGDRKPTPQNAQCVRTACASKNVIRVPLPDENKLQDVFSIIITEDRAVPYGVVAQRAMYSGKGGK